MSLHQRIGEIFLENGAVEDRATFAHGLEEHFLVQDGGVDRGGLAVVLLMESPHTDEISPTNVVDRFPLAGHAGKHVREKLNEWMRTLDLPDEAIGKLVHRECDAVRRLSIMNVCRLPFQRKAYGSVPSRGRRDCRSSRAWGKFLTCMEYIKGSPCKKYSGFRCASCSRGGYLKEELRQLCAAIAEDLRGRLEHLRRENPDALMVCCGEVAQAFYEEVGIEGQETCDFPHPEYHPKGRGRSIGWDFAEQAAIQRLVAALGGTAVR